MNNGLNHHGNASDGNSLEEQNTKMRIDEGLMKPFSRGQKGKLSDLGCTSPFTVNFDIAAKSLLVDVACFGLDSNDKLSDELYMVFYNQLSTPGGAIKLDLVAAKASFAVDLDALPATIRRLVFVAAIDGDGMMRTLGGSSLTVGEKVRFAWSGSDFQDEKAVIVGEIYLKDGSWCFGAVGQGFNNGGLSTLQHHFGGTDTTTSRDAPIQEPTPISAPAMNEVVAPPSAPYLVPLAQLADSPASPPDPWASQISEQSEPTVAEAERQSEILDEVTVAISPPPEVPNDVDVIQEIEPMRDKGYTPHASTSWDDGNLANADAKAGFNSVDTHDLDVLSLADASPPSIDHPVDVPGYELVDKPAPTSLQHEEQSFPEMLAEVTLPAAAGDDRLVDSALGAFGSPDESGIPTREETVQIGEPNTLALEVQDEAEVSQSPNHFYLEQSTLASQDTEESTGAIPSEPVQADHIPEFGNNSARIATDIGSKDRAEANVETNSLDLVQSSLVGEALSLREPERSPNGELPSGSAKGASTIDDARDVKSCCVFLNEDSINDLISESKGCFGVIFGFSGHGKSSCLDIICKSFDHNAKIDVGATPPGKINVIKLPISSTEIVYLVDVAGEDVEAWLMNVASVSAEDMRLIFVKDDSSYTVTDRTNVSHDFIRLIDQARAIYAIIPARTGENMVTEKSISDCARLLKPKLTNKKLTILVNHSDKIDQIIQGNSGNHYCKTADGTDFLQEGKTPSQFTAASPLPVYDEARVHQLEETYIRLTHDQATGYTTRKRYAISGYEFFLNQVTSAKTKVLASPYQYVYLFYPVRKLLRRRNTELYTGITSNAIKNNFTLNSGLIAITSTENYKRAELEFENTIKQAFYMEEINCPAWKLQLEAEELKKKNLEESVDSFKNVLEDWKTRLGDCTALLSKFQTQRASLTEKIATSDAHYVSDWTGDSLPGWMLPKLKSVLSILGYWFVAPFIGMYNHLKGRVTMAQFFGALSPILCGVVFILIALIVTQKQLKQPNPKFFNQIYLQYYSKDVDGTFKVDPYLKSTSESKLKLLQYFVTQYENDVLKNRSINLFAPIGHPIVNSEKLSCKQSLINDAGNANAAVPSRRFTKYAALTENIYGNRSPVLFESLLTAGKGDFPAILKEKLSLNSGNEVKEDAGQCIQLLHELWTQRLKLSLLTSVSTSNPEVKALVERIDTLYKFIKEQDPYLLGYANLENDYERDLPLIRSILKDFARAEMSQPIVKLWRKASLDNDTEFLLMHAVVPIEKNSDHNYYPPIDKLEKSFRKHFNADSAINIKQQGVTEKNIQEFCSENSDYCENGTRSSPLDALSFVLLFFAGYILCSAILWFFQMKKEKTIRLWKLERTGFEGKIGKVEEDITSIGRNMSKVQGEFDQGTHALGLLEENIGKLRIKFDSVCGAGSTGSGNE